MGRSAAKQHERDFCACRTKRYELIGAGYLSTISVGRRRLVQRDVVTETGKKGSQFEGPWSTAIMRCFEAPKDAGRNVGAEKREFLSCCTQ
jgi:hypothetical protein